MFLLRKQQKRTLELELVGCSMKVQGNSRQHLKQMRHNFHTFPTYQEGKTHIDDPPYSKHSLYTGHFDYSDNNYATILMTSPCILGAISHTP